MDIGRFLEIEQKYRLYEMSAAGVQYWIYARFTIWNYMICSSQLGLEEPHKAKHYTMIQKLGLIAGLTYHSVWKRRIPRRHADVLLLDHERRIKNGRYYECAYTERLAEQYADSVTLEKPYEYRHFKPVRNKNILYTDYIAVSANVYYQLHKRCRTKKYQRLLRLVKRQMAGPIAELRRSYPFKTEDSELYELFLKKILLHQIEYRQYEKLLDRLQPKVIVEVVYYCMQNMIINEIAHKRGIPTMELQHGTIYAEHAAYQYAYHAGIVQLPERMLLFSDFWKQQLRVPIAGECLRAVGYPLFEEKQRAYGNKRKTGRKKTVLFISQGTIGKYLGRLAFEMSRLLPAEKYRIVYKLHPSESQTWTEDYAYFSMAGIEAAGQDGKSIYEYFASSDIQIGVYSTAIYEGLGFGLRTLIFRVGHYDIMQPLVDAGYARYIDSAKEAVHEIEEGHWERIRENDFWKRGSLENIMHEIDQVLEERKV